MSQVQKNFSEVQAKLDRKNRELSALEVEKRAVDEAHAKLLAEHAAIQREWEYAAKQVREAAPPRRRHVKEPIATGKDEWNFDF